MMLGQNDMQYPTQTIGKTERSENGQMSSHSAKNIYGNMDPNAQADWTLKYCTAVWEGS